uniref:Reverse transcriptase domain-containing protein n=1 Tax=Oncorhynchus mykiss TaxID=8022 RepID=A0A8K9V0N5_ONCMY
MYIVNGRLRGDSYGRYTYSSSLGSSTVDYFITDLNPESLRVFTVRPLTPLSDHSKITVYLNRAILNHVASKPKELSNIKKCYRWKELSIQNGDVWVNHFSNLFGSITKNKEKKHIHDQIQILESTIKDFQNPLDSPITLNELQDKIKTLQPKKACGVDGILNEMIKYTDNKFQLAILKLFNIILSSGIFPNIWKQGLITPIHKSGDKFDPNNYRGICVNSNLGKILCIIINSRLVHFLNENNVLSKCQIGFLPNYRTTDHVFTLHTLIDNQTNQNKGKVFSCFVDLKRAFDSIWSEGLLYKLMESGVGGKTYDIIKSMYTNNKCAVKMGKKHTHLFTQGGGVRQGCSLSPTLFNIYINELARALEKSAAPGLTLLESEVKCLLFADVLVLLSPTKGGLQQHLDLMHRFWALTVNLSKTKIMVFQKRSSHQDHKYKFHLDTVALEHTKNYTYLGLNISATGNFHKAVNDLRNKARRAFYAIKRNIHFNKPIRIWLKILESVIEPIALYGCEVWGPLTNQDFTKWDKHQIETLHEELGRYPLIIKIQKRDVKFYNHLKGSDSQIPITYREMNPEKSPLSKLVLGLCSQTQTHPTEPQDSSTIRPNQIMRKQKDNYLTHWKELTKKQSKLECYLALHREYTAAEYLTTVTDPKLRKALTMYRLSEHSLAIEKVRRRQTWLSREDRLCAHCPQNEVETVLHFLTSCPMYDHIRETYFPQITQIHKEFENKSILINSHIYWVKFHSVPSQQQDL